MPQKNPTKSNPKGSLQPVDYEKIGRQLEAVVMAGRANKWRLILANFTRGLFFGLGTTLGAGVVIGVLLYVFSLTSDVPLLGRLFDNLKSTIEQRQ